MKRIAGFGSLLLILMMVIRGMGAQDASLPEVTAESTVEAAGLTTTPLTPTMSPTLTPAPSLTPPPTLTLESTQEGGLPTSTLIPTLTPDSETFIEPVRKLNIRDLFETLDTVRWLIDPSWQLVESRAQTTVSAALHLRNVVFDNGAIQASVTLSPQSQFLMSARGYTAVLETDRVTLYRQEIAVTSASFAPAFDRILLMDVEQGGVSISIGGQEVIAWTDPAPLPAGEVILQINRPASSDITPEVSTVDDVFVWLPTDPLTPTPTSTPTGSVVVIPGGGPSPTPGPTMTLNGSETWTPTPTFTPEGTGTLPPTLTPNLTATIDPNTPTPTPEGTGTLPPTLTPGGTGTLPPTVVSNVPNDNFYMSTFIFTGLTNPYTDEGNTDEASLEPGEPQPSCAAGPIYKSVWYTLNLSMDASIAITTDGSDFDTVLGVYTSPFDFNSLQEVACSDNAGGSTSSVLLNVRAFNPIWIQISGAAGASGPYHLSIERADLEAPLPPTLMAPADNAMISPSTFIFQWQHASTDLDPAGYLMQIDDNQDFSSVNQVEHITFTSNPQMAFLVPNGLADGVYWWRVIAQNYNGLPSQPSTARRFTLDSVAPAAPALNSPAADARLTSTRPSLAWTAAADATRYHIELAADASFTMPFVSTETATTSLTLNASVMPVPLGQGVFYWRVMARDAAGNWGLPGALRSFMVTFTTAPVHDSLITSTTTARPTFTWVASGLANSQYQIEVAQDVSFANQVYLSPTQTGLSHTITQSLPVGVYYWRVWVNGTTPGTGVYSKFTIGPAAPSAPQRIAPANNAVVSSTALTLQWSTPAASTQGGPFTYDYQVDNQQAFTSPEATVSGLTDAQVSGLTLGEGVYWWRVGVTNVLGTSSAWSNVGTFTIDNTPPAAPRLTSPTDESDTSNTRPTLIWQTSQSAVRYRVDVSSAQDFSVLLVDNAERTGTTLSLNSVLSTPLSQGVYFWRVSAQDAAGNWSSESSVSRFTVNLATAPAHQAALVTATSTQPTFTWAAFGMAGTTYRVEVSSAADFSTSVTSPALTALTYTFPASAIAFEHGTYYWRIHVNNTVPPVGIVRWFAVTGAVPSAPSLNLPANNALIRELPRLSWGTVANAVSYQVEIDDNTGFTSPLHEIISTTEYRVISALSEGALFWRVRAVNEDGAISAWSSVFSFTFDITPPSAPTLVKPDNGALVKTLQPTFSWTASAEAMQYMIQFSMTPSFDLPLLFLSSGTTFTPSAPLLVGSSYWRVAAVDAAGNVSAWSEMHQVVVETASHTAPLLNRSTSASPSLTWVPISWAQGYEVVISTSANFSGSPVWTDATIDAQAAGITPSIPLANGVYYWHVRARGGPTTWGAWSSTGTLVIDA